jgi:hypothetical protein
MKHINTKIATLLHEGFSISTLENISNDQLNLLYSKVVKEQTVPPNEKKTVTATQTTVPPGGNATVAAGSKIENKDGKTIITTTETELGEEEKVGKNKEVKEKAMSKKQQQFFGIVRGMQKGDTPKKGKAGKVAKDIDPEDAEDFAKTKHKGLPTRKTKKKSDSKEDVKKLEEGIMRLIESHLPPHTTKGELLYSIRKHKI